MILSVAKPLTNDGNVVRTLRVNHNETRIVLCVCKLLIKHRRLGIASFYKRLLIVHFNVHTTNKSTSYLNELLSVISTCLINKYEMNTLSCTKGELKTEPF